MGLEGVSEGFWTLFEKVNFWSFLWSQAEKRGGGGGGGCVGFVLQGERVLGEKILLVGQKAGEKNDWVVVKKMVFIVSLKV